MAKRKTKLIKKERIKDKTKIIEMDLEGGTRKIYHSGIWKGKEVKHGKYVEYYEAMEVTYMPKEFSNYKYGLYHGKYEAWFEDGYKAYEGHYNNGKQNGKWKTWCENGDIENIVEFKDGKKEGRCIEYYRDGGKVSEYIYKENKIIKVIGEWEYEELKDKIPPRNNEFT